MPLRVYSSGPVAPTLVLAHGAGAGHDHPWMVRVAQGLAARGVQVVTFNFPYKEEHRKVPDRGPVLEEALGRVWREASADLTGSIWAGGKSMGGRITSQAAARGALDPAPAGLVFFGYPLHPPHLPAVRRDAHLADITVPMLFLHGTRDPFGSRDEMTALVASLPVARLEIIEGGDHSLMAPKRQDPAGAALDRALDVAAAFVLDAPARAQS